MDPKAKIEHLRKDENHERVDVTTANGDLVTLDVDTGTRLPLRVTSMTYNANLGDAAIETTFSDYETVNGLKVPTHFVTKIDKYPQFDFRANRTVIDSNSGDLAAPAEARGSVPPPAAVTVTAEEVGKGIWWLAGSGNHRSILFEFDDHLVLFEAPLNELRTKAVIDTARTLRPEKPLTHVIVSHHHFDHSGGLRTYVAQGATVVTHEANRDLYQNLFFAPHARTLQPDRLSTLYPWFAGKVETAKERA